LALAAVVPVTAATKAAADRSPPWRFAPPSPQASAARRTAAIATFSARANACASATASSAVAPGNEAEAATRRAVAWRTCDWAVEDPMTTR
jgi:hypothetical protein